MGKVGAYTTAPFEMNIYGAWTLLAIELKSHSSSVNSSNS